MPKELQGLLFARIELRKEEDTFRNRRAIKKIDRKIKKVIKQAAKEQAQLMYDQTYDLLYNIIKANLN
jgi:anaerobic ribonucleoside-triphosphate reductase